MRSLQPVVFTSPVGINWGEQDKDKVTHARTHFCGHKVNENLEGGGTVVIPLISGSLAVPVCVKNVT